MLGCFVLDYIKQRATEMGAVNFHWEPELIHLSANTAPTFPAQLAVKREIELESNQRIYVPLPETHVNSGLFSIEQNIDYIDFGISSVRSRTAEIKYRSVSIASAMRYDVLYLNGNEHSGKVTFSFIHDDFVTGYGVTIYYILVTYYFENSTEPCLNLKTC